MKNFKYIIIALFCVFTLSCKKSADFLYTDIARLQFGPTEKNYYGINQSTIYSDSLKRQTFVYLNSKVLVDTVFFDVYTMGNVSTKDRTFVIKQEEVKGANNAIPGVHYKAFSDSEVAKRYVIKAGQAHCLAPVVLLRDASLKTTEVVLKFSIVANENFQLGQEQLLWRKIIFTDQISQPAAWNASASTSYFGKYSVVKHKFMIDNTGQKWDQDFITLLIPDTQQLQYWLSMVKSALIAYNAAHPGSALRDEFGDLVLIP